MRPIALLAIFMAAFSSACTPTKIVRTTTVERGPDLEVIRVIEEEKIEQTGKGKSAPTRHVYTDFGPVKGR